MRIFLGKKAIWLKEQERHLEIMISLLSEELMGIYHHILYGYKSKLVHESILKVARKDGSKCRYRLTITLDSLAGSEKTESGMTTTAKNGSSTNPEPEQRSK